MSLILVDGVTEPVFVAVDVLCPVFAVLASVNPALIEFGFDDEDTVDGYYDMVYLRTVAVACEQKVIYYLGTIYLFTLNKKTQSFGCVFFRCFQLFMKKR